MRAGLARPRSFDVSRASVAVIRCRPAATESIDDRSNQIGRSRQRKAVQAAKLDGIA
jgi:hypothetical protein